MKPGIASNVFDIANERVPGLQQRGFVSFIVAIEPSMLKESIEIELLLSAKVLRAEIKSMEFGRNKQRVFIVRGNFPRQAIN